MDIGRDNDVISEKIDRVDSGAVVAVLKAALLSAGYLDTNASWRPLSGGRTNQIWRVSDAEKDFVCKLFDPAGGTSLFPNDPDGEVRALQALARTHLAPDFIGRIKTPVGACVLYRHVEGKAGVAAVADVAATLKKLHSAMPPAGLREIRAGAGAILRQGEHILGDCCSDRKAVLMALRPEPVETGAISGVFLHGDLVPGNVIHTSRGAVLVDWQCPALGDPCEDLATFLSPAMQSLYGYGPLSKDERREFLATYDDPAITDRFGKLHSHFGWRIAAHCLWKTENGEAEYEQGLALELAALKQT